MAFNVKIASRMLTGLSAVYQEQCCKYMSIFVMFDREFLQDATCRMEKQSR